MQLLVLLYLLMLALFTLWTGALELLAVLGDQTLLVDDKNDPIDDRIIFSSFSHAEVVAMDSFNGPSQPSEMFLSTAGFQEYRTYFPCPLWGWLH